MTLKLKKISKSFNGKNIIDNFSYEFDLSRRYCISGRNGSGKSTLMKIIAGLVLPDNGQLALHNKKIDYAKKHMLITI